MNNTLWCLKLYSVPYKKEQVITVRRNKITEIEVFNMCWPKYKKLAKAIERYNQISFCKSYCPS